MAATVLAGVAGAAAVGAYLNAKYHIAHDIASSPIRMLKALKYVNEAQKNNELLLFKVFEKQALNPEISNNLFLWFEGKEWTWGQFYRDVISTANWLIKDLGVQRNEIIALYGGNSPEYLMLWFALDAVGAVPAFLNHNLTGQSLLHCVKICESRYLLCDKELLEQVETSRDDLRGVGIEIVDFSESLMSTLTDQSPIPPERHEGWVMEDLKTLLYTSGTTGMPKAIIMSAGREILTGFSVSGYLSLKPTDRFYTCMPLFHGAAHGLLVAPTVFSGNSIILGRRFSHKHFWPEVRESKANIVQYVGELCRYL